MSKTITNEQLFSIATSFCIDEFMEIFIERRNSDSWTIISSGRECLYSDSDKWEYETFPSNRTEEFIQKTRFGSVIEAAERYLRWRNEKYFIVCKYNNDRKWYCRFWGVDINECEKEFQKTISRGERIQKID